MSRRNAIHLHGGCADAGCEPEWSKVLADSKSPGDMANIMQCGLQLDCAAMCSNWGDKQSAFDQKCIAPMRAALNQEAGELIVGGQEDADAQ